MRLYKVTFVSGLAAGFVLGTRAGRERYDQLRRLARSAAESPAVQQAVGAMQAQANRTMNTAWQRTADVGRSGAARVRARRRGASQPGVPDAASGNGFVPKPKREEQRPFVAVNGEFGNHDMI